MQGIPQGQAILLGSVSLYPILIMFGMLASIITISFFWWRENFKFEHLAVLIIITIPTAIIGARLWYIFERLIYNPTNPFPGSSWYALWEGGLSIQGGVIFAGLADSIYLLFKRKEIPYLKAFGIILPSVLIGQALGRWGNFTNHEVFGAVTSEASVSWLGPIISNNMFITTPDGVTAFRVPLFFYESIANLIGYFVIIWIVLYFGLTKPGVTGAMYLIWYGIVRTSMEPLREEQYSYYIYLSGLMILAGVILWIYLQWFGNKSYTIRKEGKIKFYDLPLTNITRRWVNA